MMKTPVFAVVLAVAVAAFAAACGDDDSPGDGGANTGAATTTAPAATRTLMPTTPVDPETGLPVTFPEEFPVYQPTSVTRASDFTDRFVIQWRTEDAPEDVVAFYDTALATEPWSTEDKITEGPATKFTFSGDGFGGELAVTTFDTTTILLNLRVEQ